MIPVKPLRSLVSWVGGKRRLAPQIIRRIEAIDHDLYAEPFIGMGSVFLARERKPKFEAVNDRSEDVVNLFCIAKHHPQALVDEMRLALVARAEFERLLLVDPATMTDVQRAARFFFLQRLNYGGKPTSKSFPARGNGCKGLSVDRLLANLGAVQRRLSHTVIENMDWTEFLRRYDGPRALFYADPPYFDCEGYYGPGLFAREDHARLADALLDLRGHFILSINDVPQIEALYAGRATIERVETVYTVSGRPRTVVELLISGGGA
ncbi:DNA adenine methylase [Rhodospirillum sp. A1_3_36]|uniref:DNA adenine methylase n=1 Tax=Rhodospirillum sp. A1_3_36 TaxID=3391666 RepID=UPI0039A5CEA4